MSVVGPRNLRKFKREWLDRHPCRPSNTRKMFAKCLIRNAVGWNITRKRMEEYSGKRPSIELEKHNEIPKSGESNE